MLGVDRARVQMLQDGQNYTIHMSSKGKRRCQLPDLSRAWPWSESLCRASVGATGGRTQGGPHGRQAEDNLIYFNSTDVATADTKRNRELG